MEDNVNAFVFIVLIIHWSMILIIVKLTGLWADVETSYFRRGISSMAV